MVLSSFQITLIAFEIFAVACGSVLLARFLNVPGFKPMAPVSGRLSYWPVEGFEMALLVVLFFLLIIVCQGALGQFFGERVKAAANRKGLELLINGLATHGGGLLAWPLFYLLRRQLFSAYHSTPPTPSRPAPARAPWTRALLGGIVTLFMALPVIILVSEGWTMLLTFFRQPSEAQDMIGTFRDTQSPLVLTGMLLMACVLAPINEEMLFRRGLYHYFRQRFGRIFALSVSASLFGLMHLNLAGFVPLATLGVILALAYERTGDIRVPIIAHGLFNLNTIAALLAGLSG